MGLSASKETTRRSANSGMSLIEILLAILYTVLSLWAAAALATRLDGWWRLGAGVAVLPALYFLIFGALYVSRWRRLEAESDKVKPNGEFDDDTGKEE